MPRWLRSTLTVLSFATFFGLSLAIGLVASVVLRFRRQQPEEARHAFTTGVNQHLTLFAAFIRDLWLVDFWHPRLPAGFGGGPFLLIANHPTLIDVVLLLSSFPQLTCVVKASWFQSPFVGPLVRQSVYIPGPGFEEDEADDAPVFRRIEERLRAGIPVLVFPEGTRSGAERLRRFRRGAIEAALRAEVPILPLFIAPSRAFLMKGQKPWEVPAATPRLRFSWLPVVETAGRAIDPKALTRALSRRYRAEYAEVVAERRAIAAGAADE